VDIAFTVIWTRCKPETSYLSLQHQHKFWLYSRTSRQEEPKPVWTCEKNR